MKRKDEPINKTRPSQQIVDNQLVPNDPDVRFAVDLLDVEVVVFADYG